MGSSCCDGGAPDLCVAFIFQCDSQTLAALNVSYHSYRSLACSRCLIFRSIEASIRTKHFTDIFGGYIQTCATTDSSEGCFCGFEFVIVGDSGFLLVGEGVVCLARVRYLIIFREFLGCVSQRRSRQSINLILNGFYSLCQQTGISRLSIGQFLQVSIVEQAGVCAQGVHCLTRCLDSLFAVRITYFADSINQAFGCLCVSKRRGRTINGEHDRINIPVVSKGTTFPNLNGCCITCPCCGFIFIADSPAATHPVYFCHGRSKRGSGFDDYFRYIVAIFIRKGETAILTVKHEIHSTFRILGERATATGCDGHPFVCRTCASRTDIRDTGVLVPNNIHRFCAAADSSEGCFCVGQFLQLSCRNQCLLFCGQCVICRARALYLSIYREFDVCCGHRARDLIDLSNHLVCLNLIESSQVCLSSRQFRYGSVFEQTFGRLAQFVVCLAGVIDCLHASIFQCDFCRNSLNQVFHYPCGIQRSRGYGSIVADETNR